jgi:hypothetical protein
MPVEDVEGIHNHFDPLFGYRSRVGDLRMKSYRVQCPEGLRATPVAWPCVPALAPIVNLDRWWSSKLLERFGARYDSGNHSEAFSCSVQVALFFLPLILNAYSYHGLHTI